MEPFISSFLLALLLTPLIIMLIVYALVGGLAVYALTKMGK